MAKVKDLFVRWILPNCGCLVPAVVIGLVFVLVMLSLNEGGLRLASNLKGGGCYLKDDAFRFDKSTISTPEEALQKIKTVSKNLPSAARIQQIIDESKKANINPAILIAFWGAEQEFGAPYKAFGYGCDGKRPCPPPENYGFEKQLAGALKVINDAIEGQGNYKDPEGENIWTRLLYNYVAAERLKSYEKYGYVSDRNENRIKFLTKLVPDQVICLEKTLIEKIIGKGCYSKLYSIYGPIDCAGRNKNCSNVEKNLVAVNFMGKEIAAHKRVAPAFQRVAEEIKAANIKYDFWREKGGATFNCRANVNYSAECSFHSFGIAIDINPKSNPNYPRQKGKSCKTDIPEAVIQIFKQNGFRWGGDFRKNCDAMHFEWIGEDCQ